MAFPKALACSQAIAVDEDQLGRLAAAVGDCVRAEALGRRHCVDSQRVGRCAESGAHVSLTILNYIELY